LTASYRCQAILFDMDGTLVNSIAAVERQWRRWAARHGLDPEPMIAIAHGRRTLDTLRELAPAFATEEEAIRFDAEEALDREGIVAIPGAARVLASMPAGRWAVVTSADRQLATDRLQLAGLPVPDILVTGDEVRNGKPDPEGYLTAAARLGFAPADCLVVEDTPAGVAAGHAAGMQVMGVATTYAPEALRASIVVPDLLPFDIAVLPGGLEVRVTPA